MRLRLGRRRPVRLLPYTGKAFCGCCFLNGDHVVPCPPHVGLTVR